MAELVIQTRDEIAEKWRRNYKLRYPLADVREGSEPYARSLVVADTLAPMYANARTIAAGATSLTATGEQLTAIGEARGVYRRPATSSTGYVTIQASVSGGTIVSGDVLIEPDSQARFRATQTRTVSNGEAISVTSEATGVGANLIAGKKLQWVSPRPGIGMQAVVAEQSDGSGLIGGASEESEEEYQLRVERARAATPTESEFLDAVMGTPGVRVEAAFAYPGSLGPGTTGIAFTVPPGYPGGNRIPTSAQMREVLGNLVNRFTGDDGIVMQTVTASEVDVSLVVEWASRADSWTDGTPWPSRFPFVPSTGSPGAILASYSGAGVANAATLSTTGTTYAGIAAPSVGATIGVFSRTLRKFVKKRIATVSGSGPWSVTFSTNSADSDPERVGTSEVVCPWSDALNQLVSPVLAFFDAMGPGEQQTWFFDPGRRQKRYPSTGEAWPCKTTNRLGAKLLGISEISNVTVAEGGDTTVPTGSPGVVYLAHLRRLGIYAS